MDTSELALLFISLGWIVLLLAVYLIVALVIAKNAKKRGFSWSTYFWINFLLGSLGWVVSIFFWRSDLTRQITSGAPSVVSRSGFEAEQAPQRNTDARLEQAGVLEPEGNRASAPRKDRWILQSSLFGLAFVLVGSIVWYFGFAAEGSTPLHPREGSEGDGSSVAEMIEALSAAEDVAFNLGPNEYFDFVRQNSLPGAYNQDSESWKHAERALSANWEKMPPPVPYSTENIVRVPGDEAIPGSECSDEARAGDFEGTEFFLVEHEMFPEDIHLIAVKESRAFMMWPLCDSAPMESVRALSAVVQNLVVAENAARASGPEAWIEFVETNALTGLYNFEAESWQRGKSQTIENWDTMHMAMPFELDYGTLYFNNAVVEESLGTNCIVDGNIVAIWITGKAGPGLVPAQPYAYAISDAGDIHTTISLCSLY